MDPVSSKTIHLTVNGEQIDYDVEARRLLVHFNIPRFVIVYGPDRWA